MEPDVPLVVPEVNPLDILKHRGIIANPNCSTIQMVVALKPCTTSARVRRVVVSTYQSVSGAGMKGIHELEAQTGGRASRRGRCRLRRSSPTRSWPTASPRSTTSSPRGYTKEEMKMVNETRKIMGDPSIDVSPTCVRVPVPFCHSESILVETERPISPEEAKRNLGRGAGRDRGGRSPGAVAIRWPPPPPARTMSSSAGSARTRQAQHVALLVRQRQPPQGRGHQRRPDRREAPRARARASLTAR